MERSTIYSVGYGGRSVPDFITLLKRYSIAYLIDVRSKTYMSRNLFYSPKSFALKLKACGVVYANFGDTLGGVPMDRGCYNSSGRVDYSKVRESDFFKETINRLLVANEKSLKVALMCHEAKSELSHRFRLIGEELYAKGVLVNYIMTESLVLTHEEIKGKYSVR